MPKPISWPPSGIPVAAQQVGCLGKPDCPVVNTLHLSYYWSLMQVEYALDLVFKTSTVLAAFYPHLLETLIHAVKPQDIATFSARSCTATTKARWVTT